MQIFVEDILEQDIINNLKYIYNKTIDNQVMLIFFIRYFIYYNDYNLVNDKAIFFLLKELNLPKDLKYMNEPISMSGYENNNMKNIMDNLIFRYLDKFYDDPIKGHISGYDLLKSYFIKYTESTKKILKGKRNKINNYEYVYKYLMLENVYNDFLLQVQPFKRFNNFEYPEYHNDFEITFDEFCQRYYNDYIINEEKLVEKELEDYLFKNNFENIKFIDRQVKIKSGIIDLLGIDDNEMKVLIELKVNPRPKDLIWQLSAYRKDLIEIYKTNIRTIAICPKLNKNILDQIPKEYEIYEFTKLKYKNEYKFIKIQ